MWKSKILKKSYFRKHALDGITLNIKKGHILGLLGPNGSGKSTLLKIITGLVRPSSGKVLINGMAPSFQTKAQVAYLPEVDHLYPWMSVREIIDFIAAFYQDWQPDRAAQLLEIMKLDPKQKVRTLSKGQRAQLKLLLTLSRKVPSGSFG